MRLDGIVMFPELMYLATEDEKVAFLGEMASSLPRERLPHLTIGKGVPTTILRERWRASRLPSVPSALRGLDARQPLPLLALIGASGSAAQLRLSAIVDHGRRPLTVVHETSGS